MVSKKPIHIHYRCNDFSNIFDPWLVASEDVEQADIEGWLQCRSGADDSRTCHYFNFIIHHFIFQQRSSSNLHAYMKWMRNSLIYVKYYYSIVCILLFTSKSYLTFYCIIKEGVVSYNYSQTHFYLIPLSTSIYSIHHSLNRHW